MLTQFPCLCTADHDTSNTKNKKLVPLEVLSKESIPGCVTVNKKAGAEATGCGCNSHQDFVVTSFKAHVHGSQDFTQEHEQALCCGHDHASIGESNGCCGHVEVQHAGGVCCGHDHAPAQPVDLASLGETSATRAIYRIMNMDCPMEEALIRKRLESMEGITSLEFNLMQRVLTVNHTLDSTAPIEEALNSIGMTPEAISGKPSSVAVFSLKGLHGAKDEESIKKLLADWPGVFGSKVDLAAHTLTLKLEPTALPGVSEALLALGLEAKLLDMQTGASVLPDTGIPWKKLAVAGIAAALSEGFELFLEWGVQPFGINLPTWQVQGLFVGQWLPLFFSVLAISLAGLGTYKKGWIAVRNFNLNINALMSVAVTGAVFIGQFPEAAMVMVLFNLSEAIEAKALDKARNAIKDLLALAPDKATVLRPDNSWMEMDVRQIAVGSRVRVRPGEKIGLDGRIVLGLSTINQAPITGESLPVEKTVGDKVYAGTINEEGSFEFEVTAAATDSTLARIIHAVEEAQGGRAPMQRFVDQFAKYYTPAVFLLALFMGIIPPLFMGETWTASVYTALVILVIGCPCALVISTPVSIVSGMAAATRHGILIKGGMFLEKGRQLRWLALDKTGTITHGEPRQTDFMILDVLDKERVVSLATSLAARSDHPVSKAIAANALENQVKLLDVSDFTAIPGQGVKGQIAGEEWYLGNHRMVEDLQECSATLEAQILALEQQGKSVVILVGAKGAQGLFAVADTIRQSSREAVQVLKKMGVKTMMLTGDNEHTARVIAEQAGVDDFMGNLLPEDKLRVVTQLGKDGLVGMVGDGINDAPALAKADIGFAMAKNGTDTAIETADVALMDDDLKKIPRFIGLSKATYAILVQNITLALGVKALFFMLTFMGLATMWMAVFADVGTALLVIANGLRAMRK